MDETQNYIPNPDLPPIEDWQKEIAAALAKGVKVPLIKKLDEMVREVPPPAKREGLRADFVIVDELKDIIIEDLEKDLRAIEIVRSGGYNPRHATKKTLHQKAVERRKKRKNGGHK